jgi:hypothetical protein
MNEANLSNVSEFYKSLNSTEVLKAQGMIKEAPVEIVDKLSYDMSAVSIKAANDAIKHIETNRKMVTTPLDAYKKSIMDVEKDAVAPLNRFIAERKAMMLLYSEELERKQREANDKIKAEAAEKLANSGADAIADIMGNFTDQLVSIQTEQAKNIRVTKKARIAEGVELHKVDWAAVVSVLIAAHKFNSEVLLTSLPAAMKDAGVSNIFGVEVYEHRTQVIG